ncbi:hypothetical protein AB5N19_05677 [Seiridium cardinale]
MEDRTHPTCSKVAVIGREITTKANPKAVVVFSAHWQDSPNKISINMAEKTELIYDLYNFPPHYYECDYPNKGSPGIAEKVIDKLMNVGIEVERLKRRLEHRV